MAIPTVPHLPGRRPTIPGHPVVVENPFRSQSRYRLPGPPDMAKMMRVIDLALEGHTQAYNLLRAELHNIPLLIEGSHGFPISADAFHIIQGLIDRDANELFAKIMKAAPPLIKERLLAVYLQLKAEKGLIAEATTGEQPEPPSVNPVYLSDGRLSAARIDGSRQIKLDSLPEEIQAIAQEIYKQTYYEGRNEFAACAIELPKGKIFAQRIGWHESASNPGFTHQGSELLPCYNKAQAAIKRNPELAFEKIKVYLLHTHPDHPTNIRVHSDGRALTFLSYISEKEGDYQATEGRVWDIIKNLRSLGFLGEIEIIQGAVPVPYRPLSDLPRQVYLATYTVNVPFGYDPQFYH